MAKYSSSQLLPFGNHYFVYLFFVDKNPNHFFLFVVSLNILVISLKGLSFHLPSFQLFNIESTISDQKFYFVFKNLFIDVIKKAREVFKYPYARYDANILMAWLNENLSDQLLYGSLSQSSSNSLFY